MCLICLEIMVSDRDTTSIKKQILVVKELLREAELAHQQGNCTTIPKHIEDLKAEQFKLSRLL